MTDVVIFVALPDGGGLALPRAEFEAARRRATELGLNPAPPAPVARDEKLVNSRELAAIVGVGSTTLEGRAARGEIPSLRLGRALRFRVRDVQAAMARKEKR